MLATPRTLHAVARFGTSDISNKFLSNEAVSNLFSLYKKPLEALFRENIVRKCTESVMTLKDFIIFCQRYIPELKRTAIMETFRNCASLNQRSDEKLEFNQFCECLARIAFALFSGNEWEILYNQPIDKLRLLLFWIDNGSDKRFDGVSAAINAKGELPDTWRKIAQLRKGSQMDLTTRQQNEPIIPATNHATSNEHEYSTDCYLDIYGVPHIPLIDSEIHMLFDHYCSFGDRMNSGVNCTLNSSKFYKFIKDCGLLDEINFFHGDVDIIFKKWAGSSSLVLNELNNNVRSDAVTSSVDSPMMSLIQSEFNTHKPFATTSTPSHSVRVWNKGSYSKRSISNSMCYRRSNYLEFYMSLADVATRKFPEMPIIDLAVTAPERAKGGKVSAAGLHALLCRFILPFIRDIMASPSSQRPVAIVTPEPWRRANERLDFLIEVLKSGFAPSMFDLARANPSGEGVFPSSAPGGRTLVEPQNNQTSDEQSLTVNTKLPVESNEFNIHPNNANMFSQSMLTKSLLGVSPPSTFSRRLGASNVSVSAPCPTPIPVGNSKVKDGFVTRMKIVPSSSVGRTPSPHKSPLSRKLNHSQFVLAQQVTQEQQLPTSESELPNTESESPFEPSSSMMKLKQELSAHLSSVTVMGVSLLNTPSKDADTQAKVTSVGIDRSNVDGNNNDKFLQSFTAHSVLRNTDTNTAAQVKTQISNSDLNQTEEEICHRQEEQHEEILSKHVVNMSEAEVMNEIQQLLSVVKETAGELYGDNSNDEQQQQQQHLHHHTSSITNEELSNKDDMMKSVMHIQQQLAHLEFEEKRQLQQEMKPVLNCDDNDNSDNNSDDEERLSLSMLSQENTSNQIVNNGSNNDGDNDAVTAFSTTTSSFNNNNRSNPSFTELHFGKGPSVTAGVLTPTENAGTSIFSRSMKNTSFAPTHSPRFARTPRTTWPQPPTQFDQLPSSHSHTEKRNPKPTTPPPMLKMNASSIAASASVRSATGSVIPARFDRVPPKMSSLPKYVVDEKCGSFVRLHSPDEKNTEKPSRSTMSHLVPSSSSSSSSYSSPLTSSSPSPCYDNQKLSCIFDSIIPSKLFRACKSTVNQSPQSMKSQKPNMVSIRGQVRLFVMGTNKSYSKVTIVFTSPDDSFVHWYVVIDEQLYNERLRQELGLRHSFNVLPQALVMAFSKCASDCVSYELSFTEEEGRRYGRLQVSRPKRGGGLPSVIVNLRLKASHHTVTGSHAADVSLFKAQNPQARALDASLMPH